MATNAKNVSVGKPGANGPVFRAPSGTTLPTDATTALAADFACLGHLSDDGWTKSVERESEDINAYGGQTVLTVQTSKKVTVQMTLIEALNVDALKAVHGDSNVTGTLETGITVIDNAQELEEAVWVLESILSDGVLERLVIPRGKVTEVGDTVYKDDEPIGYEITVTCLPDTAGHETYSYKVQPSD